MNNKVLGAIPARFASRRFPGKPLEKIGDKTMVQWVWEAAKRCNKLDALVVATDDERIEKEVKNFGGDVIMTSSEHESGTDRIIEVAKKLPDYDVVVNIQGDEPGIENEIIDGIVKLKIEHPEWEMTTAASILQIKEEALMPERVKVVISKTGRALYFSRSLIPFPRNKTEQPIYLHLGIYAYNRDFLIGLSKIPVSNLEKTEALEQLRVLEYDYNIGVHIVETGTMPPVDTPEDLNKIKTLFKAKGLIE